MSPDNLSVLDFSTIRCGELPKSVAKKHSPAVYTRVQGDGYPQTRMVISVVQQKDQRTYTYNSIKKIFIYKQVGKWV